MNRMNAVLAAAVATAVSIPAVAFASGQATFGAQNWWQTARESKFQEFGEQANGAWLEDFLVQGKLGSFTGTGWGSSLFLTQQRMGASLDSGIRWQLDGRYQQLPHMFSMIARSPYLDTGNGQLGLSDSLQRQNQDLPGGYIPRMNAELANAPYVPLDHRTDVSNARLRFRPAQGWRLDLKGEQRAKVGTKAYGMSFGFSNANEVWEPIHQRTSDVSATANYARKDVSFRAQLGYSTFDNLVDALVVDNPRRLTDSPTAGSGRGRIDLYPDNNAVRGQVDLNVRLRPETSLSGTLAMARIQQDDPWLPFTINSAISQASLDSLYGSAARSTDARALRTTGNLRLTNRFSPDFKGTAFFRVQHYENETDVFPFRGVVQYDQSLVRDTVGFHNHPYGNQQVSIGLDVDGRVADGVNLTAGYTRFAREHTLREVEDDREDELRARLFAQAGDNVTASVGYTFGARRLDEFHVEDYQRPDQPDTVYLENPGLRRFDVADRDRHQAVAEIGWSPADRVDFGFSGDYAKSEYKESQFGLQEEERWITMFEMSYRASASWDLSGGYGFGRIDSDQASQERSASGDIPIRDGNLSGGTDWTARIRDRNDFGFLQTTWKLVPSKVSIVMSYWVSRDQAKYYLDNETATAVDLPDTYSLRQEGHLEARFHVAEGTEIIGKYGYDTWKVEDFAATDIPLLGVAGSPPGATAIYLGAGLQNYTAHIVGLAFSRHF